jgi:hypothetical protein
MASLLICLTILCNLGNVVEVASPDVAIDARSISAGGLERPVFVLEVRRSQAPFEVGVLNLSEYVQRSDPRLNLAINRFLHFGRQLWLRGLTWDLHSHASPKSESPDWGQFSASLDNVSDQIIKNPFSAFLTVDRIPQINSNIGCAPLPHVPALNSNFHIIVFVGDGALQTFGLHVRSFGQYELISCGLSFTGRRVRSLLLGACGLSLFDNKIVCFLDEFISLGHELLTFSDGILHRGYLLMRKTSVDDGRCYSRARQTRDYFLPKDLILPVSLLFGAMLVIVGGRVYWTAWDFAGAGRHSCAFAVLITGWILLDGGLLLILVTLGVW